MRPPGFEPGLKACTSMTMDFFCQIVILVKELRQNTGVESLGSLTFRVTRVNGAIAGI